MGALASSFCSQTPASTDQVLGQRESPSKLNPGEANHCVPARVGVGARLGAHPTGHGVSAVVVVGGGSVQEGTLFHVGSFRGRLGEPASQSRHLSLPSHQEVLWEGSSAQARSSEASPVVKIQKSLCTPW